MFRKRWIRRLFLLLSLPLAAIGLVVIGKTAALESRQLEVEAVPALSWDHAASVQRLQAALRVPTVVHDEEGPEEAAIFREFQQLLADSFPRVHEELKPELVGEHSLLFHWEGSQPDLAPLLLLAHMDVVPIAAPEAWTEEPFSAVESEGFVWGRGALDDKGSLIAILEAVRLLMEEGFVPQRSVWLAFGADEEVGGEGGASLLAQTLESRGVRPLLVLDEGGLIVDGLVDGLELPLALVGIAEKGYCSLELTAQHSGGHSSMPPPQTAVGILAAAVQRMESHPLPASIGPGTDQFLDWLAPELPLLKRVVLANSWIFGPLILSQYTAQVNTNAAVRTTQAVTVFEGSPKENVLPQRARAVANYRLLPGQSVAGVKAHVQSAIGDARVSLRLFEGAREASAVSAVDTAVFHELHRSIRQIFPEVVVAPYLVVGATDARHYQAICAQIFRFLPIAVKTGDLARIHGADERIAVQSYLEAIRFYAQLIRNIDDTGARP